MPHVHSPLRQPDTARHTHHNCTLATRHAPWPGELQSVRHNSFISIISC
jgi:hypothetical protein